MALFSPRGLALVVVWSALAWAGRLPPPLNEDELAARIAELKRSTASTLPNDTYPRVLRLGEAQLQLGVFYEQKKRFAEADRAYADALATISAEKTPEANGAYRSTALEVGRALTVRGEYARARPFLDAALARCGTDERDRLVRPGVLRLIADWHARQKQWAEAETALREAIKVNPPYAYNEQLALIDVYLGAERYADASALIAETEKSRFANSEVVFRRVRLLRATGETGDADRLEEQARTQAAAEAKSRAARQ